MKEEKKWLIWSSDFDVEDYEDWLKEEYPEITDPDEKWSLAYDDNMDTLGYERMNLDIQLQQPIIVIADLGLWCGRRPAYSLIRSGNIKDCLYSECDSCTWYLDYLGDLRCKAAHHDGTNYYLYRVFRDDMSEEQQENFMAKLCEGKTTRRDINRYTRRLGDEIADVYGWDIPRRKKVS